MRNRKKTNIAQTVEYNQCDFLQMYLKWEKKKKKKFPEKISQFTSLDNLPFRQRMEMASNYSC